MLLAIRPGYEARLDCAFRHQPDDFNLSEAECIVGTSIIYPGRVTIGRRHGILSSVSSPAASRRDQGDRHAKDFSLSYFWRIAEERILDAQRAGAFDDLPGKGRPLNLEDMSWVPEELRLGYHILKNAHVLPPEAELMKDIHSLEDLLKHVEDEGQRRALAKSIQFKIIRLDLLKRRSLSVTSVRDYGRKLAMKFWVK